MIKRFSDDVAWRSKMQMRHRHATFTVQSILRWIRNSVISFFNVQRARKPFCTHTHTACTAHRADCLNSLEFIMIIYIDLFHVLVFIFIFFFAFCSLFLSKDSSSSCFEFITAHTQKQTNIIAHCDLYFLLLFGLFRCYFSLQNVVCHKENEHLFVVFIFTFWFVDVIN